MELFFRYKGTGPPVVILHGLYGSSDNWLSVAGMLGGRYSVYIPDLRNHGRSPHHPASDYDSMCADIEEFVARHVRGRFTILGHSMGGKLAVTYAARNPSSIAALIVADISPFNPMPPSEKITRFHIRVLDALNDPKLLENSSRVEIEEKLSLITGDRRVAAFLLKNLQRSNHGRFTWRLNTQALKASLDSIMGPVKIESELIITGFPVLFIRGGESDYLPENHLPSITRVFPAAELKTIAGAGHWLHAEKPEIFTKIVTDFLA